MAPATITDPAGTRADLAGTRAGAPGPAGPTAPLPVTVLTTPSGEPAAVACCSPLVAEPLGVEEAVGLAGVLKAIADPARLRIVSLLAAHEGGEACVCDLTEPLGLSQPTVSHHLKTLVDAGLVRRDKRGVWAYFSLVPGALDGVARVLADGTGPAAAAGTGHHTDAGTAG